MTILHYNYLPQTESEYSKKIRKDFCETLSKIINDFIIPTFGKDLKLNIYSGLFTSDNYGSYKIGFFDKNDNELCYVIADTIIGEWKVYNRK